jgi:hypothetical protein
MIDIRPRRLPRTHLTDEHTYITAWPKVPPYGVAVR